MREEEKIINDAIPLNLEKVVKDVFLENIKEQRKSRIWGNIFKFSIILYLFSILFVTYYMAQVANPKFSIFDEAEHVGMLRLDGDIGESGQIKSSDTIKSLRELFENPKVKSIVLEVNSGGGSSYTSAVIYDEVLRLKEKHNKEIVTVAKEVLASGAYYIASATDNIYAQKTSIIGSIGVRMGSFNFAKTIEKLGVERKIISSGDNKTIGDTFTPMTKEQENHLKGMTSEIHKIFIDDVSKGRGKRIDVNSKELFSGLIWTGVKSKELGLIDGYFTTMQYVRAKYGEGYLVKDYTKEETNFMDLFKGKVNLNINIDSLNESFVE